MLEKEINGLEGDEAESTMSRDTPQLSQYSSLEACILLFNLLRFAVITGFRCGQMSSS